MNGSDRIRKALIDNGITSAEQAQTFHIYKNKKWRVQVNGKFEVCLGETIAESLFAVYLLGTMPQHLLDTYR